MIFIAYLSRYYVYNNLFKRIPAFLGPVEYGVEIDTFDDDMRDGKYWELERVVDHTIRRSKTYYLVR